MLDAPCPSTPVPNSFSTDSLFPVSKLNLKFLMRIGLKILVASSVSSYMAGFLQNFFFLQETLALIPRDGLVRADQKIESV